MIIKWIKRLFCKHRVIKTGDSYRVTQMSTIRHTVIQCCDCNKEGIMRESTDCDTIFHLLWDGESK